MQGISTSECGWLTPSGNLRQSSKQTEAEMLKRRQLLQEFVFWYFDQFLVPLLRVCSLVPSQRPRNIDTLGTQRPRFISLTLRLIATGFYTLDRTIGLFYASHCLTD